MLVNLYLIFIKKNIYFVLQKIEDKDFFVERKDEEEHGEDWNYFDYNEL